MRKLLLLLFLFFLIPVDSFASLQSAKDAFDDGTLFTGGTGSNFTFNVLEDPVRYYRWLVTPSNTTVYTIRSSEALNGDFTINIQFNVGNMSGGGGSWSRFGFYDGSTFIKLYDLNNPGGHPDSLNYYGDWTIVRTGNSYDITGYYYLKTLHIGEEPAMTSFPSEYVTTEVSFNVTAGSATEDVYFQYQLYGYGNRTGGALYSFNFEQEQPAVVPEPLSVLLLGLGVFSLIKNKRFEKK
ncbi:MAG: PEP-CTERM sorting domain-containing protein [Candidatus Auribacterota bacterium]|jgi:hypothetical protein|nr:PEP-CTERM sorting domain-containing protein [Candidatus Auribacterota bacterium]